MRKTFHNVCHSELYKGNRRSKASLVTLYPSAKPLGVSESQKQGMLSSADRLATAHCVACARFVNQVQHDKKRIAFTLAEVLITLTIIGVIAALTIPNLMKNYQSHATYVALNKNYTILKNAYKLIEKDYGSYYDWEQDTSVSVKLWERFGEHLKYVKKCENNKNCFQKVTTLDGKSSGYDGYIGQYGYKLTDGTNIVFGYTSNSNMSYYGIAHCGSTNTPRRAGVIHIDINGDKKPNRCGYDIFAFIVYPCNDKLGVIPAGFLDNNYTKNSCNRTGSQATIGYTTCAYYVLRDHGIKY